MPKLNQRGVVHLLLPIILLLGLITGVYLVTSGNPLKLFSKASNDPIVLKDENGNPYPKQGDAYQVRSAKVKVEITSTLGPPAGVSSPISPNQPSAATQQINFSAGQPNSFGLTVKVRDGYKASDLVTELKQSFKPQDSRYQDPARDFIMAIRGHDSQTNRPLIYNPRSPQQPGNSDFPIKAGEGYIIDVRVPGSSAIQGQALTSPITINIPRGRSLISFPALPNTVKTASDLVSELGRRDIRIMMVTPVTIGSQPFRPERPNENNLSILPATAYYLDNASSSKDWLVRDVPQQAPRQVAQNPNTQTTIKYRIAESPAELQRAPEVAYTSEPTVIDYEFKNVTERARKYLFVEFIASNGQRDGRQVTVDFLLPRPIPAPTPTPVAVSKPDLTVELKATAGNAGVGAIGGYTQVVFTATVKNIGTAIALSSVTEVVDTRLGTKSLTPGASQDLTVTRFLYPGSYQYAARADADSKVDESNENNNTATVTIVIPTSTSTPIPSATPQTFSKRVFVTSTTYNGNLGGLSGADNKCQERANAANLGGTWKAWLSDNYTSASSRLNHSNLPYKLLNGTTVANKFDDFINSTIPARINITENKNQVNTFAWTNTKRDGSVASVKTNFSNGGHCFNWTSSTNTTTMLGVRGNSDGLLWQSIWTWDGSQTCGQQAALYCFEQ